MLQMAQNKGKSHTATIPPEKMSPSDKFPLLDLSRFIDQSQREHDRQGNLDFTIVEGVTPRWYVVEVRSGSEFEVRDKLAERRCGVFLPTFGVWSRDRFGKSKKRMRKLFPGYVFVFVWGIEKHWTRITGIDGVIQILKDGNEAAIVPDEIIAHLRIREVYEEEKIDYEKTEKKRRRRRKKRHVEELEGDITIRPWSAFENLETLDAKKRRAVFHKALGLAS